MRFSKYFWVESKVLYLHVATKYATCTSLNWIIIILYRIALRMLSKVHLFNYSRKEDSIAGCQVSDARWNNRVP